MTTASITRSLPFWLIFAASALGGMTNAASTPMIPVYVEEVLGGGPGLSGAVISLAAVTSMIAMPVAGMLADRRGYRVIAASGSALAVVAMILMGALPFLWGAGLSRLLFGLGNAAAMTLVMAWLVAITPPSQRGRALSIYGLSVWIGLALGPQIGTAVNEWQGPTAVFYVCAALELATLVVILVLPRRVVITNTSPIPLDGTRRASWIRVLRVVWVPGVAAASAWCGEGLMVAFLIVHLSAAGVPAIGIMGAAGVFGVFAVSVIGSRVVLANLPDRIGPLRATAISLVCLSAGLATLGLARDFWVAALGAVIIGVGFSPLYPSLTMLATRGLNSGNRALGLGMFSSFTSIGYAGGALIGGLVLAVTSSMWAFLIVAGLQLAALAVVTIFTRDDSPRPPVADAVVRHPAA